MYVEGNIRRTYNWDPLSRGKREPARCDFLARDEQTLQIPRTYVTSRAALLTRRFISSDQEKRERKRERERQYTKGKSGKVEGGERMNCVGTSNSVRRTCNHISNQEFCLFYGAGSLLILPSANSQS